MKILQIISQNVAQWVQWIAFNRDETVQKWTRYTIVFGFRFYSTLLMPWQSILVPLYKIHYKHSWHKKYGHLFNLFRKKNKQKIAHTQRSSHMKTWADIKFNVSSTFPSMVKQMGWVVFRCTTKTWSNIFLNAATVMRAQNKFHVPFMVIKRVNYIWHCNITKLPTSVTLKKTETRSTSCFCIHFGLLLASLIPNYVV